MKTKKILKITFIILTISLFGFYLFISQKESTVPTLPLKPQLPSYFKKSLPIVFKISEKDVDIPDTSSVLFFESKGVSADEAQTTASKLGFTKEIQTFEDIDEGNIFFWNNQEHFLLITEKTGHISYGLNTFPSSNIPNKQISDSGYIEIAEDFLLKNILPKGTEIRETEIIPLKTNPLTEGFSTTTKNQATVHQVNFSFKNSSREILTIDPSTPLMFVQILPDGNIHSSEGFYYNNVSETNEENELKKFDDIVNSKKEIKLISLLNDYINIRDLTLEDIESIEIESIKLVYLLDTSSFDRMPPVFLLEGKVQVKNSTANRALLYLPAFK